MKIRFTDDDTAHHVIAPHCVLIDEYSVMAHLEARDRGRAYDMGATSPPCSSVLCGQRHSEVIRGSQTGEVPTYAGTMKYFRGATSAVRLSPMKATGLVWRNCIYAPINRMAPAPSLSPMVNRRWLRLLCGKMDRLRIVARARLGVWRNYAVGVCFPDKISTRAARIVEIQISREMPSSSGLA